MEWRYGKLAVGCKVSWCLRRVHGALRYECSSGASCKMMEANGIAYPDEGDRERNYKN